MGVDWLLSAQRQPWLSLTKPKLKREGLGLWKYQICFSPSPSQVRSWGKKAEGIEELNRGSHLGFEDHPE